MHRLAGPSGWGAGLIGTDGSNCIAVHPGANRLLTAAHAALLADRNLGGLALGIREQECEWDVEDADAVAATIPARYCITYRTLDADLSTKG